MLPPQRAIAPVTPSSVAASISGASSVTRWRSQRAASASRRLRFDERLDRHLHAGVTAAASSSAARTGLHLARRHVRLHAQQQPAVHPDLLHVVHRDAVLGQRGEQPLGDARAVLAAHRHQERRRCVLVRGHDSATSFSVTHPAPSTQRLHDPRGHAGHHAAVRDLAAHHRTRRHDDVLADLRARAGSPRWHRASCPSRCGPVPRWATGVRWARPGPRRCGSGR